MIFGSVDGLAKLQYKKIITMICRIGLCFFLSKWKTIQSTMVGRHRRHIFEGKERDPHHRIFESITPESESERQRSDCVINHSPGVIAVTEGVDSSSRNKSSGWRTRTTAAAAVRASKMTRCGLHGSSIELSLHISEVSARPPAVDSTFSVAARTRTRTTYPSSRRDE